MELTYPPPFDHTTPAELVARTVDAVDASTAEERDALLADRVSTRCGDPSGLRTSNPLLPWHGGLRLRRLRCPARAARLGLLCAERARATPAAGTLLAQRSTRGHWQAVLNQWMTTGPISSFTTDCSAALTWMVWVVGSSLSALAPRI